MGKMIWNKFHALYGADLKVGFETTFPRTVVLNLYPLYKKSGLIHNHDKEPIKRIYGPAVKILGDCRNGEAAQVFFEPVSQAGLLFRRLVFARKIEHFTQKPRRWMVAARHGEPIHFGFDSWNSRNERYLPLAYPGKSSQFVPVYFKIQTEGGDFVFLEIWAWDDSGKVVVQGRRVSEKEAPESLISASPI